MGDIEYRLKALKFQYGNTMFILEFRKVPLLQISGESGSGKSLLAERLSKAVEEIEHFGSREDWLIISAAHREGLKELRSGSYKDYRLIVIDNADVLIDDEIQDIIYRDVSDSELKTYWIILGRRNFGCIGSTLAICHLESLYIKKKGVWLFQNDFEYSKDFRQIPLPPGMSKEEW